jgi:hypothetical protein
MADTIGMGIIHVTFTRTSMPVGSPVASFYSFVFNPTVLTMPAGRDTYAVAFQLTTNVVGATILPNDLVTPLPPSLAVTSQPGGLLVTFRNSLLPVSQTYHYELKVDVGGTTITSSDPEIIIPPG